MSSVFWWGFLSGVVATVLVVAVVVFVLFKALNDGHWEDNL